MSFFRDKTNWFICKRMLYYTVQCKWEYPQYIFFGEELLIYMKKKYNESAEDYLETILMLSKTLPVVRAVDIAT